jgi:xanthine dehydrogenase small subunit
MSFPIRFVLNREPTSFHGPGGLAVLHYLREQVHLTGTKEGCREGDCGACTVMIGERKGDGVFYQPAPSCLLPMAQLHGKHLVTIEGLNQQPLSPVQQALVDEGAVQCGFCTPGIVVSIVCYLLQQHSHLDENDAKKILSGHLCRCTGYAAIKRAIARLVPLSVQGDTHGITCQRLIEAGIIPAYFQNIPLQLAQIETLPDSIESSVVVAGGTDLYVQKGEIIRDGEIRCLHHQHEMNRIQSTDAGLIVSSATTFEEFIHHPLIQAMIPEIITYGDVIASWQVRGRATLVGNIINASPIGDMTILLLALQAQIEFSDSHGSRRLALAKLFQSYKKLDASPDEWVSHIFIPRPAPDTRIHFEKVAKRQHLDIASVNGAIKIRLLQGIIKEVTLSCGGVAPIPLLLQKTSQALIGMPLNPDVLKTAADGLQQEIQPIDDVRGSAEYKRLLARQLFFAHFIHLYPETIRPQEVLWI